MQATAEVGEYVFEGVPLNIGCHVNRKVLNLTIKMGKLECLRSETTKFL